MIHHAGVESSCCCSRGTRQPISSGLPNEIMAINKMVVLATGLQQARAESLVFFYTNMTQDVQCPDQESAAGTGDDVLFLLYLAENVF